jgi:dihydroorotate dehydrogenase electron transfer subunit
VTQIKDVKQENPIVKTLVFDDKLCQKAMPGQFVMVWIPGLDEIPMSVSSASSKNVSVCVKKVGQATEALHRLKIGDLIGIRGPLGNGFSLTRKGNALMVGGGTGLVPLTFLGEKLAKFSVKTTFLAGAKTKNGLLLMDRIESVVKRTKGKMITTTDDGSCGIKCMATEPAKELLEKEKFDMVYTCGPEPMMRKMLSLAEQHNVALQASLERLMRCAIGVCGSCVIGGFRVCMDGPVFAKKQLLAVKDEFGRFKLGFDGRKTRI